MKKLIVLLIMVLLSYYAKSQKSDYLPYGFKSIATLSEEDDEEYRKIGSVILNETRIIDCFYNEKDKLESYLIFHKTIKVYTQKEVDQNNKIYIALDDVTEVVDIKAKFISKDNKITEVDKDHIKTIKNLETEGKYKIFAIEGVEPEGVIDFFYILKKIPVLYNGYYMQSETPKLNVNLTISMPINLRMRTKSYNGLNDMSYVLVESSGKRIYTLTSEFIPAFEKEKYAAYKANLQRIEYTMCYNYLISRTRFYTFNEAAQNFYEDMYSVGKQEKKAVKKFISKMDISSKHTIEEKVRKVESYIKTHINLTKKSGASYSLLNEIIANKLANSKGFTKLYVNIFKKLEIRIQPLLTCNRNDFEFDKDFDAWNNLSKNLIYFPELRKTLIPDHWAYRLGMIPEEYTDNYALFFKLVKVSDVESFIPEVKRILHPAYQESGDSLFLEVNLTDGFTNTKSNLRRVFTGYSAFQLQPFYEIMNADQKKNVLKRFAGLGIESAKTENIIVENTQARDFYVKPLIISCELENSGFIEKTGKNLLLNVGEMIGARSESYNPVKERKLEIINDNTRHYYRSIVVHLPKGYKVMNLDELNMNITTKDGDFPTAAFISTATIKGNDLVLENTEYYSKLRYPAMEFDAFKAVINATAEFSKKTLILTEN